MTDQTTPTVQEQQLVMLAMAEGFIKRADPAYPMGINELVSLWSELIPRASEELAQHLMTAATMIGWLIFEEADDRDEPVLNLVDFYREVVLSSPGGILGDQAANNE
jgi:hypothetical protein